MLKRMILVFLASGLFFNVLPCGISYCQSAKNEGIYPGINAPWKNPGDFKYKGVISIGDVSDLTGPAAKTVIQCSAGLADWLKYQNEYLGGVEGYKIEATTVDTKFDPQNVVNTVSRFIDEKKSLIYSVIMYMVPASIEVCNRREMPVVSSSATVTEAILDPEKEKTEKNYFFAMSPVVASRMAILVKFAMDDWKAKGETGKPKFGTFNQDNQNGHEAATATRIYANKMGGEFTVHTFHSPSITDARAQVSALKKAGVDYITGGPDTDQPLTVFALELERQKDAKWRPTFLGHTDFGTAYMDTKNKAFEGHYTYQYCMSWEDVNVPIIAFAHKITEMWHPNVKQRPFVYMLGFQGGIVISEIYKRAIQQYGDPTKVTGEQIRKIMEEMRNFDPLGISGPINWFPYDHQGVTSLRIARCQDGKLVGMGKFVESQPLEPQERYGKYWLQD